MVFYREWYGENLNPNTSLYVKKTTAATSGCKISMCETAKKQTRLLVAFCCLSCIICCETKTRQTPARDRLSCLSQEAIGFQAFSAERIA